MAVGKLKRVSDSIPLEFLRGPQGVPGKDGKDGIGIPGKDGRDGKDGLDGVGKPGRDGRDGVDGKDGTSPEHEVRNGEIRFRQADGTWGDWLTLGTSGSGGKISNNTYHKVEVAEYHVNSNQLDLGHNIFGVDYGGDVTIFLPKNIDKRALIVINDESASAATNNITIKVEE